MSDNKLRILALDVTDAASVKAAARELEGQVIDLLINNAGIGGPRGQTIGNIDYEAWASVLDTNTMGPMRVTEAFVDHVARSERKLVVTLTSGMGSIADNKSGGSIAYRSSKAAVNMVMRSLAIDLALRGLTCVVINPGWVRTDMGGPHATLTPPVLGEPSVASRNDRAADLLEKGFTRYFWKSLFGTRLDGLAIQASLSDSPAHLRDSVCGVTRNKSKVRRSVKSKLNGLDAQDSGAPANAISASEAN